MAEAAIEAVVDGLVNAGEILIGQSTPFSAANFVIGCPASLPTSGFADVSSGITVEAFLKRTAVARADDVALARMTPSIIALADHEGFPAHAAAPPPVMARCPRFGLAGRPAGRHAWARKQWRGGSRILRRRLDDDLRIEPDVAQQVQPHRLPVQPGAMLLVDDVDRSVRRPQQEHVVGLCPRVVGIGVGRPLEEPTARPSEPSSPP